MKLLTPDPSGSAAPAPSPQAVADALFQWLDHSAVNDTIEMLSGWEGRIDQAKAKLATFNTVPPELIAAINAVELALGQVQVQINRADVHPSNNS